MHLRRRDFLASTAIFLLSVAGARASVLAGQLPWQPNAGNPPTPAKPGPWVYFNGAEGRAVEAIADRIIPSDPQTPGGKDAGCAVFVDRQLAGPYGRDDGLYNLPPFKDGAKNQGPQSEDGPAQKYRKALAALDELLQIEIRRQGVRRLVRQRQGRGPEGTREPASSSSAPSTARASSSRS